MAAEKKEVQIEWSQEILKLCEHQKDAINSDDWIRVVDLERKKRTVLHMKVNLNKTSKEQIQQAMTACEDLKEMVEREFNKVREMLMTLRRTTQAQAAYGSLYVCKKA